MRNVIHTDGNYQVELTGKGKFLVRNQAGNELGQFVTNDAALQKIADDRHRWEGEVAKGNAAHAIRNEFFNANQEFETNQLAWQVWRNDLYERIQRQARYLAAHERNLAKQDASQHHFDRLQQDKEALARAQQVYGKAVSLDTKLKDAGFSACVEKFSVVWADVKHLMDTSAVAL